MPLEPPVIPNTAVCLGCGYALRGLPRPVCPECGREFDPSDPATFRDTSKPSFWLRFATPPSIGGILMVTLMTAGTLNHASIPLGGYPLDITGFGEILTSCVFIVLTPVLLAPYILRLALVCRANRHTPPTPRRCNTRGRWRWYVLPVCSLLILSAFVYPWPLWTRFALSRRAFEQVAQQSLAGTWRNKGPQWIGLYKVGHVGSQGSAVWFHIGKGFLESYYAVYDPTPRPSTRRMPGQVNWYIEYES